MTVEAFYDDFEYANTFLVIEGENAIIIDPGNNISLLPKYLKDKKLLAILLTHGHFDHFRKLDEVRKNYPVKCYLHKNALLKLRNDDSSYAKSFGCKKLPSILDEDCVFINDGMNLEFDNIKVKVIYQPGHTDCSVSFIIGDMMFSGDTLFKGSVGRTDLVTGNRRSQKETLKKLNHMKINYFIYPGHGDGTTLFEEQKNNPYLINEK